MSSFLFYGCWNNINCKNEFIHRDAIITHIKNSEKTITKMFIAGDNWYSTKVKNNEGETVQYYLISILMSGFDKLYKLKKELHIACGNHDEAEDNDKSSDEKKRELKKRCMIKTQKKYIDELNSKIDTLDSSEDMYEESSLTYDSFIESDLKSFKQITLENLKDLNNLDVHDNKINIYVDDVGIVEETDYIVIIINTNKINDKQYFEKVKKTFEIVKSKQKNKQESKKKKYL